MKTRGISCLAAIAILLTLTACAGPEITEQDSSMANAAALSRNYCVDARSRGEAARMAAIAQMDKADTLIIGGTSLVVYPAAGLIDYFHGRNLIVINLGNTSRSGSATLSIAAPIGQVLKRAVLDPALAMYA